ncbi:MAG: PKD domain-containing protein, partial [Blastocatellia bacterium]
MARNNIIISCGGPGLGTYSGNNIRFENNTCWDVAQTYNGGLYVAANSRNVQAQQITFVNNIVTVTSTRPMFFSILLSDQLNSDYNIYFRPNGGNYGFWMETPSTGNYWSSISNWQSAVHSDSHSLIADPHLDSTNLYKPLSGSPAIDAGTTVAEVPVDYAGTTRPQGRGYDVGAFEIVQGSTNRPPTVSINASVTTGTAPLTVNFVSNASDPDGTVVGYRWTFGDGATSTTASPSHVYTAAGTYSATLTVTDNGGLTASASVTITVTPPANLPPHVSLTPSTTSGTAPLTVSFVSTASDPDGQVVSYAWTFGDGGTSTAISPSHVYTNAGSFTAQVTVTDNQGATASAS